MQSINIAKKVGFIKICPTVIKNWKINVRASRDASIKHSRELASVYRNDAKSLLALATALGKNTPIDEAREMIDSLDTNVREQVPDEVYDLVFED